MLLLADRNNEGWFALSVGVGLLVFSALPPRVASARRLTRALLVALVGTYAAARSVDLVARGADASDVVLLCAQTLILCVALGLLRAYLSGIGRLITSLAQAPEDLGYARVLELGQASSLIESELARSRRREESLTFIELRSRAALDRATIAAQDYFGPSSIRYLERVYLRARLGVLLSQHARRSDVVISEPNGGYLILSPEADERGARAMSHRVAQAARSELGMTISVGIASFPDDGESLRDLLAVASDRAGDGAEQPGSPAAESASHPVPAPVAPQLPRRLAMISAVDLGESDRAALERCVWLARYPVRGSGDLPYLVCKRVLDIVVASLVLVVTAPLLLLAAIAIKLESPGGPVLFHQTRAGRKGRGFRLYKLRTMVPDASERKQELLHLNSRTWPDFKIEHDPRVLRVGRILRAASVDELPQLVNVLKGDMSLVGPRPTSLVADGFQHWQRERFTVKPGLTGLWQVSGRDEPSLECRSRLDIAYVTRRSLPLDVVILCKTVPAVVLARGAY